MIYNVKGDFTQINETSGTIQNNSHVYSIEVSDKAEAGSGVLLYPLNKFSFSDKTIYLRCTDASAFAEIRVTPFAVDSSGGGSGSGGSSIDIASDELISGMLTDVFGNTSGGLSGIVPTANVASDKLVNDMLADVFGDTSGGISSIVPTGNVASDELINDMLNDVFGDTSGGASGYSSSGGVATDDQINDILDDIFPLP